LPERELFELWLARKENLQELENLNKTNNRSISQYFVNTLLQRRIKGFNPSLIKRNEHGKPILEGLPYSFNLSHSGDVFALLITSFSQCGVDIQSVEDPLKFDEAFRSVFTDREYGLLKEKGKAGDCFQLWSLKEAYVKALGGSIWYGRDFESDTSPGQYSDLWFKRGDLFFYSTEVEPGLFLSMAVSSRPEVVDFMKFPPKDFS